MAKDDSTSKGTTLGPSTPQRRSPDSASSSKEFGSAVSTPTHLAQSSGTGSSNAVVVDTTTDSNADDDQTDIVAGVGTGSTMDNDASSAATSSGMGGKTKHPRSLLMQRRSVGPGSSSGTTGQGTAVGQSSTLGSGVVNGSAAVGGSGVMPGSSAGPRRRLSAIVTADEVTAAIEGSNSPSASPRTGSFLLESSTERRSSRRGSGVALAAMAALAVQEQQAATAAVQGRKKSTTTTGATAGAPGSSPTVADRTTKTGLKGSKKVVSSKETTPTVKNNATPNDNDTTTELPAAGATSSPKRVTEKEPAVQQPLNQAMAAAAGGTSLRRTDTTTTDAGAPRYNMAAHPKLHAWPNAYFPGKAVPVPVTSSAEAHKVINDIEARLRRCELLIGRRSASMLTPQLETLANHALHHNLAAGGGHNKQPGSSTQQPGSTLDHLTNAGTNTARGGTNTARGGTNTARGGTGTGTDGGGMHSSRGIHHFALNKAVQGGTSVVPAASEVGGTGDMSEGVSEDVLDWRRDVVSVWEMINTGTVSNNILHADSSGSTGTGTGGTGTGTGTGTGGCSLAIQLRSYKKMVDSIFPGVFSDYEKRYNALQVWLDGEHGTIRNITLNIQAKRLFVLEHDRFLKRTSTILKQLHELTPYVNPPNFTDLPACRTRLDALETNGHVLSERALRLMNALQRLALNYSTVMNILHVLLGGWSEQVSSARRNAEASSTNALTATSAKKKVNTSIGGAGKRKVGFSVGFAE